MDNEIKEVLRKKALGYFVDTEIETGEGKTKKLKYIPPDLDAIKMLESKQKNQGLEFLTNEELIHQMEQAIKHLKGEGSETTAI